MSEKNDYTLVKIYYTEDCIEDPNYEPTNEWDNPDVEYFFDIEGTFTVTDENGEDSYDYDLIVPYQIDEDKTYFLLYVTYGSGDSFHSSSGHVNFIHMFETLEDAEECAELIRERYDLPDYKRNKTFKLPIGHNRELIPTHTPWEGYFNNLQSIDVESVRYIPKKVKKTY